MSNINNMSKHETDTIYSYIIVARHGERLDYVMRDAGHNWLTTASRPWDPPLSDHGKEQGLKLGRHLAEELNSSLSVSSELQLELPLISAIYSSPFLRCRQTAVSAMHGLQSIARVKDSNPTMVCSNVKVEMGLAESINDNWYRSWSLPESDGTWGYKKDQHIDQTTALRVEAKQPIQTILDWKYQSVDNSAIEQCMDLEYDSKTRIDSPYTFYPSLLETKKNQRKRMLQTVETLSEPGKTILLVSHGGPVTHLYEELTGNPWYVHGESTFCCYSVYRRRTTLTESTEWEAIVVNQSSFLKEKLVPERHVSNTA